jgi:Ser/Thr protein kinase RdoA (MazF antagonist)
MDGHQPHPFSRLQPDVILDAVEGTGLRCDGRFTALNSYENRVYQVGLEDGTWCIAKFYRPARWSDAQILEEHAFARELADAEVPVVAPLAFDGTTLFRHAGFRFALWPRHGGRAPELDRPEVLEWLGRFLARLHTVGARRPFAHRSRMDVHALGRVSVDWLLEHGCVPADREAAYRSVAAQALEQADACFGRAGPVAHIRLHGDCHGGNVLWTDAGPHFVDLDDCCTGPAIQDLWMLLSGGPDDQAQQLATVLRGYEVFRAFDPAELLLLEALRTLRQMHYVAWLARRWDDPAFPASFPWFGTQRFWEDHILHLREQIAAMQEPPLRLSRLLKKPNRTHSWRSKRQPSCTEELGDAWWRPDPLDDVQLRLAGAAGAAGSSPAHRARHGG